MSTYSLSGFALAGLKNPSFAIPYFVKEGTNEIFVQELDDTYHIETFRRFKPEHYNKIAFPAPVKKKIGESGLLAYQLKAHGQVSYGDIEILRQRLSRKIHNIKNANFFVLEAAILLGHAREIHKAIVNSSLNFEKAENQRSWISIQSSSLKGRRSKKDRFRPEDVKIVAAPRPPGRTLTRADLCEAVYQKVGLPRTETAMLVEMVLKEITDCLERGEPVKLSSFGSFAVRKKGGQIGRKSKAKEVPSITPRRVMVFKPSAILKQIVNTR